MEKVIEAEYKRNKNRNMKAAAVCTVSVYYPVDLQRFYRSAGCLSARCAIRIGCRLLQRLPFYPRFK